MITRSAAIAILIGIVGCDLPEPGYRRCITYGPAEKTIQVEPNENISIHGWGRKEFKVFSSEGTRIQVSSSSDIRVEAGDCPITEEVGE